MEASEIIRLLLFENIAVMTITVIIGAFLLKYLGEMLVELGGKLIKAGFYLLAIWVVFMLLQVAVALML